MNIYINHKYDTEILELSRVLFMEEIHVSNIYDQDIKYDILFTYSENKFSLVSNGAKKINFIKELNEYNFPDFLDEKSIFKFALKKAFCEGIMPIAKREPLWGILTGIRPVKLVHKMLNLNFTEAEMVDSLINDFLVSKSNAEMIVKIGIKEKQYFPKDKDSYSLYVSIPYCPTKCIYCSFPTHAYKKWSYTETEYIEKLKKEITAVSEHLKDKKLDTIYIGGGTPSSIKIESIEELLKHISDSFDISNIREFTFEAGRPDTIDYDKLKLLRKYGVNRISINPQTMNDEILKSMGRTHTATDIIKSYEQARELGFEIINMDLIIGLPGDTIEGFKATLEILSKLKPENITVHTLAIKKAAVLKDIKDQYTYPSENDMKDMVDYSKEYLLNCGFEPYYIYRQQNMIGNFENIGYSIGETEGIYNILMMEEVQNIIAVGVGGVSKIHQFGTGRFDNIANVRDIVEYLERYEEMIERKLHQLQLTNY